MAILNMVRDYERIAKFQLGRYVGMKGPGLVWVIPIIQAGTKVDTREQYFDVPPQRNITRDNAGVDVDFVVYLRVMGTGAHRPRSPRLSGRRAAARHDHAARRRRRDESGRSALAPRRHQ